MYLVEVMNDLANPNRPRIRLAWRVGAIHKASLEYNTHRSRHDTMVLGWEAARESGVAVRGECNIPYLIKLTALVVLDL